MDYVAWIPHAIWATVALCAIASVTCDIVFTRVRSNIKARVDEIDGVLDELDDTVEAMAKDFAYIRGELEKLKAIPPKAPRL